MPLDEVYPHAPVSFVALELRHPVGPTLAVHERRAAKALLQDFTPILRSDRQLTFEIVAGSGQSSAPPRVEEFPKYFNRDTTLSIGYRPDAIVVECTKYPGWSRFREFVSAALAARAEVARPDGVERVGLRYVDEIRIPEKYGSQPAWHEWVSEKLLNQTGLEDVVGLPEATSQGFAMYGKEPGRAMVLRYGAQVGFAVDPNGALRKQSKESGAFFLIDIDSYWTPSEGTPEFRQEDVLSICQDLHAPVRSAFEHLISDKLRDEVLRVA